MSAIYFEMFKIYTLQGMVNYNHKNPCFRGDYSKCLYYLHFSGQLDLLLIGVLNVRRFRW